MDALCNSFAAPFNANFPEVMNGEVVSFIEAKFDSEPKGIAR